MRIFIRLITPYYLQGQSIWEWILLLLKELKRKDNKIKDTTDYRSMHYFMHVYQLACKQYNEEIDAIYCGMTKLYKSLFPHIKTLIQLIQVNV